MTDDVRAIVQYRMDQANEALKDARAANETASTPNAVNRAYYAMFYAALALLACRQIGTSRHSGAIAMFAEQFVKTGRFPRDVARRFRQAFDRRCRSDYGLLARPTPEEAAETLIWAEQFVGQAGRLLAELGPEESDR